MADPNYMGGTAISGKDDQFASDIEKLVSASALYRDSLSEDRMTAMKYYQGEMDDIPPRNGWSQVVSQDVRSTIKKVLPSIVRTILGNEIIAEYSGEEENDVAEGEQATDYINYVVLPESNGENAIHDAIHDALLLRNGILYAGIEDKIKVTGSTHLGLDENALAELLNDEGVEVIAQRSYPDPNPPPPPPEMPMADPMAQAGAPPMMPGQMPQPGAMPPQGQMPQMQPMAPMPVPMLYDVKIKRTEKKSRVRVEAVPPEEYLIHPDAIDSIEAPLVGRETRKTRSDLIAMGYDRDMVMNLPAMAYNASTDGEKFTRRPNTWLQTAPDQKELEMVLYYDLYVHLDYDDDGIAELRHVCAAGDLTSKHILVNEYGDFVRYFDMVKERRPHQWEGVSIADDVIEIQRVKTALLRYAMDNTYQVVNPTKTINVDKLKGGDADAFMNPEPGRPAWVTGVDKVSDAVQYDITPYIGDKAMLAIDYWDKQITTRTGVDDMSSGLPDDALQNVTAKATALMEQKGIAQTELMVRTIANCLKPFFVGLLKLTIQVNDVARMVRLRGKSVEVDPRSWNANMDVRINTGLGAGTRERDMMAIGQIMTIQEKLEAAFGADSPILQPENIYNAVESAVNAAGIKAVGKYFTKPTPESIAAYKQQRAAQKSPEQQKVEAQIQLLGEQSKANTAKETAQMQADMMVTEAKKNADLIIKNAEAQKNQADEYIKNLIETHKIASTERIELAKIMSAEKMHEQKLAHDFAKHQAGVVSDSIMAVDKAQQTAQEIALAAKAHKTNGANGDGKAAPKAVKTKFIRDPKTNDLVGMETSA